MNHELRTALDGSTAGTEPAQPATVPLTDALNDLEGSAAQLARRSGEALHARSLHWQQQARHAGDLTVGYVRTDPVKSMLIAAAVGAGLMALLGLLMRGRSHR